MKTLFGLIIATTLNGALVAAAADAIVAADGTGQYKSVQDALVASPQTASLEHPWTILVKTGVYTERIYAQREKRFVHLIGEDAAKTVITFGLFASQEGPDGKPIGTFRTPTAQIDAGSLRAA